MAVPGDLTRLHAHEMAAALRSGEVSSRELTEAHLERAERQNHALHAWLTIDRARALAEADAADVRLAVARVEGHASAPVEGDGGASATHPLLGVPIALKDLVSVRGGQVTAGAEEGRGR